MRFLSVLLILGGLALAFVLPIYQTDFAGSGESTVTVFDRANGGWRNGWMDREVYLAEGGNPYRIRLEGRLTNNEAGLPGQLPVFVELSGPAGTVFSGEFAFGVRDQEPSSNTAVPRLFVSLPEFAILESSDHLLTVRVLSDRDISLSKVDATLVSGAEAADWSFTPVGLGIFAFGTVLYLAAGRRRRKERQPEQPKWGR